MYVLYSMVYFCVLWLKMLHASFTKTCDTFEDIVTKQKLFTRETFNIKFPITGVCKYLYCWEFWVDLMTCCATERHFTLAGRQEYRQPFLNLFTDSYWVLWGHRWALLKKMRTIWLFIAWGVNEKGFYLLLYSLALKTVLLSPLKFTT